MSEYPKQLKSPDGSICNVSDAKDEATLRALWGQEAPVPEEPQQEPAAEEVQKPRRTRSAR